MFEFGSSHNELAEIAIRILLVSSAKWQGAADLVNPDNFPTGREPVHTALAMVSPSELKLERQLDGARTADLIEGVEAAALAAASQVIAQHLG